MCIIFDIVTNRVDLEKIDLPKTEADWVGGLLGSELEIAVTRKEKHSPSIARKFPPRQPQPFGFGDLHFRFGNFIIAHCLDETL